MNDHRLATFRRHLTQSVGSSGISFGLTLITTPLMTRLFSAEAYGINGMLMTAATLISALGLFGLPTALARERGHEEQARLMEAAVQLALLLAGATTIAVGFLWFTPAVRSSGIAVAALLLPGLVLIHALQKTSDSLATARAAFPVQAASRLVNAASSRGFTLLVGWLATPTASVMLIGDMVGRLAHLMVTGRYGGFQRDWRNVSWRPRLRAVGAALRQYRDFAVHSNLAAILPMATTLGVQMVIGIRLGVEATGEYVLAKSIITLPVSLIALATAPIVFHRLSDAADHSDVELPTLAVQVMLGYVAAGVACMLPILLFGPELFAFVFGGQWERAGKVAAILSVPQMLAFSLVGTISMFRVTRRIRAWLWFELFGSVAVLVGILVLGQGLDFERLIFLLSVLLVAYQLLMHTGCLWASRTQRLS